MFKQTVNYIILGAALALVSLPSQAVTIEQVVNPRQEYGKWVTDGANILIHGGRSGQDKPGN